MVQRVELLAEVRGGKTEDEVHVAVLDHVHLPSCHAVLREPRRRLRETPSRPRRRRGTSHVAPQLHVTPIEELVHRSRWWWWWWWWPCGCGWAGDELFLFLSSEGEAEADDRFHE